MVLFVHYGFSAGVSILEMGHHIVLILMTESWCSCKFCSPAAASPLGNSVWAHSGGDELLPRRPGALEARLSSSLASFCF